MKFNQIMMMLAICIMQIMYEGVEASGAVVDPPQPQAGDCKDASTRAEEEAVSTPERPIDNRWTFTKWLGINKWKAQAVDAWDTEHAHEAEEEEKKKQKVQAKEEKASTVKTVVCSVIGGLILVFVVVSTIVLCRRRC